MTRALRSLCRPSRGVHLPTTCQGAMVVLPDGNRAPSGGRLRQGCPSLPDIPADANGGLCIGRSFADALGTWGPLPPNKLRRVYTGALLATTIIADK